jgi:hypothetical protein
VSAPREIRRCEGPKCPTLIDSGGNGRRKYCGDRCKDRAYRARVAKLAAEQGTHVRASLTILSTPTRGRRSDAQTTRQTVKRAPSLRVSYRKAVEAATEEIARQWLLDPGRVRKRVEKALRPLLSPAAREHLERAA